MDLKAVKSRLGSLNQESKSSGEKIDYSKYLWKPKAEGKYQIRFVPSILNKDYIFEEHFVIYDVTRFPASSLINWGEECPVNEFAQKLINSGDTEQWKLGKKLEPKLRVFAPVIARGEEEKGVRHLEISKTLYMELLTLADDPEYENYEDVESGVDFTVVASKVENRKGFNLNLTPRRKSTPLSEDPALIEKWLKEQPSVLELKSRFKHTYESLKEALVKYMSPEDAEETEVTEPAVPVPSAESNPPKNFELEVKKSKDDEFDALWPDEIGKENEEDVPF